MSKQTIKGALLETLVSARGNALTVKQLVSLGATSPTPICGATVARAMRKLRAEGKVTAQRVPGSHPPEMAWIASSYAAHTGNGIALPSLSMRTPSVPVQAPAATPTTSTQPAPTSNAAALSLQDAVEGVVADFVKDSKPFSAWDITQALRERVNSGLVTVAVADTVHVNGKVVARIVHDDVKQMVHDMFAARQFPAYSSAWNGKYWEYNPITAATASASTN